MSATVVDGAEGKAARRNAPRSSHAEWAAPPDRADPVATLEAECETRVPELIPIRNARMAVSSFTFFRGAAGLMASDLATTPTSGIRVQLCGDAHLLNFGGFASPERNLIFDVNDFDETLPGPWEWDVKRLVTSMVIAARHHGLSADRRRRLARATTAAYRGAMRRFARSPILEVWYERIDERDLAATLRGQDLRRFERTVAKARSKDSTRAVSRLTEQVDGTVRIAANPPLIVPIEDVGGEGAVDVAAFMGDLVARYRASLQPHRRRLFDRFRYVHAARKVVGVGSVGTRCWILLFVGRDAGDPLVLQAKEAGPSVLEPYAGASPFANQGHRVVDGQRLMQAAGDILLGWLKAPGVDGVERDFYVRQLWDWKASADVDTMSSRTLELYGSLCAQTLARAHARSGATGAIAGYLGSGDAFDQALARFAEAYADQNERDYEAFVGAIADERMPAAADPMTG